MRLFFAKSGITREFINWAESVRDTDEEPFGMVLVKPSFCREFFEFLPEPLEYLVFFVVRQECRNVPFGK